MWARIDDATGTCAEFTDTDPAGRYHPDTRWEPVAEVLAGWADTAYIAAEGGGVAPPSLDYIRDQAKARVAARRWAEQERGALYGNHRFHTDAEGRGNLTGAVVLAQMAEAHSGDGTYSMVWKAMDGFVTMGLADLVGAGVAVGGYVSACFAREQAIGALIDAAATVEEVVAVYTAEVGQGWPADTVPAIT